MVLAMVINIHGHGNLTFCAVLFLFVAFDICHEMPADE